MEAEAKQGRWRRDVVVSGGGERIPEDVIPLILSYLPLKSLGRFKSVSRAWCLLIQSLNLPPSVLGLFYEILSRILHCPDDIDRRDFFEYKIGGKNSSTITDPALSFLPNASKLGIKVVDCCNGLLLLHQCDLSTFGDNFYICNPLTKSWTRLYSLDSDFCRLDFDPKVSPNFKIVTFPSPPSPGEKPELMIRVLSSENSKMKWKRYGPVKFRDPSDQYYVLMPTEKNKYHALWEGSLYLLFGRNYMSFGGAGRIMRFDLLEDQVADRQLIQLPKGTKMPHDVAIGRSRNKLCLAGLNWIGYNNMIKKNNRLRHNHKHLMDMRLRVWSLSNRAQTVWVLEHDNIITSSNLPSSPPESGCLRKSAYLAQFHPFLDVVFILYSNIVFAYDLKNLSLNEVCRIGSNKHSVIEASIFPFIPSTVDCSTKSKTKHKRKSSHPQGERKRISATPCNC